MLDATVIAHMGEQALYVLVPLAVVFLGWRVWDRLRGGADDEIDQKKKGQG